MKSIILALFVVLVSGGEGVAELICNVGNHDEMQTCLQGQYSVEKRLSYSEARGHMFSDIDNENGAVRLVYSGKWYKTEGIPDHNFVNTCTVA